LELRFGKVARLAASLSYTLQMTLYMGIVVYAPALALEALTGITKETAILSIGNFYLAVFLHWKLMIYYIRFGVYILLNNWGDESSFND